MLKQFRRKGCGEKLRLNLTCGLRLFKALSRLEKLGSRLCPPCKVRTVGTFVWRCGYAASAFCDSLRNCAWALPAACGGCRGRRCHARKTGKRAVPAVQSAHGGHVCVWRGCRGRRGEGWVEVFNVLTGHWGGKRDISQPVARGVVSVGRKAASLCVRDANLRRMC